MPPTPSNYRLFDRRLTWGHRGERIGEATNPGPEKSQEPKSKDAAQLRWERRPVGSKCPECHESLIDTTGRAVNFAGSVIKQARTKRICCSHSSPGCEATMIATDRKYTCMNCWREFCNPCMEGLATVHSQNPPAQAAASSGSAPSVPFPSHPEPSFQLWVSPPSWPDPLLKWTHGGLDVETEMHSQ